mmetsp:Transcript_13922/g.48501  ORF Transcript_13922/g.48501 Transcript_13922/m.48501 type:complete len:206 (+) Transcript_13922:1465-2082(+)
MVLVERRKLRVGWESRCAVVRLIRGLPQAAVEKRGTVAPRRVCRDSGRHRAWRRRHADRVLHRFAATRGGVCFVRYGVVASTLCPSVDGAEAGVPCAAVDDGTADAHAEVIGVRGSARGPATDRCDGQDGQAEAAAAATVAAAITIAAEAIIAPSVPAVAAIAEGVLEAGKPEIAEVGQADVVRDCLDVAELHEQVRGVEHAGSR